MITSLVRRLWADPRTAARVARAALYPAEVIYGTVAAVRNEMYDRQLLASRELALPAVSVGNLTVGGTWKTPISAWLVRQLFERGARPAVVLRDYGGDESLVHAALNPGTLVVRGGDRVDAVRRARAQGADVAVLDDGFQHRRARREFDVVLLSADDWRRPRRLLPAGPWREPLSALRRASLIVATRKAASIDVVDEILTVADRYAPSIPRVAARLAPDTLVNAHTAVTHPLSFLTGREIVAVAGVAEPDAFRRQLEELGARVGLHAFRDHHPYSADDAVRLARAAEERGVVVCTLKDAVKLAPVWPRDGPGLWYLSQDVILERGRLEMERLVDDLLEARARYTTTVG